MKKNAFIIAEYNPFHNGHLYHINETRKAGAECIIVLMSGNFVQRGECALFPKYERAEAAVHAGADLVLEIPMKYVIGGSASFSLGAIKTALSTCSDGTLSFGAENEPSELFCLADFLSLKSTKDMIKSLCEQKGYSFPRAQCEVVKTELGEYFGEIMSRPNNLLAVHYITDCKTLGAPFDFFAVKRIGAEHDSEHSESCFSSAMHLRKKIITDIDGCKSFIPDFSFDIISECLKKGRFVSDKKFEIASLSRLQTLKQADFANVNGVNQGLENLFYEASRKAISLDELCTSVKSKRFTYSRLRQVCLSAALGVNRTDITKDISFINVLAFNDVGRKILAQSKKSADVMMTGVLSNAKRLGERSARDIEITEKAEMFYNLCMQNPEHNFSPYDFKPYVD